MHVQRNETSRVSMSLESSSRSLKKVKSPREKCEILVIGRHLVSNADLLENPMIPSRVLGEVKRRDNS